MWPGRIWRHYPSGLLREVDLMQTLCAGLSWIQNQTDGRGSSELWKR